MRVTNRMMVDNAIRYMNDNLQRLSKYQQQASNGKAFQRASDNPSAATASLTLRSNLETIQGYLNTTGTTNDWMEANEFALGQTDETARRVQNLVLDGLNEANGPTERQNMAVEIDAMLAQVVDLANHSNNGNYIFGGFKTDRQPFTLINNDADPLFDAVGYNGDHGIILRHLGPDQTISQNLDGEQVFSPLISAIINARDALNANRTDLLESALDELKVATATIGEARTTNGARQRQVQLSAERIEKTQLEITSLLSQKEDINMAEAISNLRYQETVYQTVLEVSQRTISALSLFDMLS